MNQAKDTLYKEKSWCVQWGKHGAMVGTAWVEKASLAHCQEHGNCTFQNEKIGGEVLCATVDRRGQELAVTKTQEEGRT